MKTKALIAGGAAAAVLAGGGVAYAATSAPTTTPGQGQAAGSSTTATHKGHRGSDTLPTGRIEHGQFVVEDKAGNQITHDIVNGTVTAVSATSVAVKDGTGATTTFAVDATTRVHVKGQAKGTKSTISDVKTGGTVTVLGTGTGPYTATAVSAH